MGLVKKQSSIMNVIKSLIKDGEPSSDSRKEYAQMSNQDQKDMIKATKEIEKLEKTVGKFEKTEKTVIREEER